MQKLNKRFAVALVAVSVGLAAGSAQAQDVSVDYDKGADFSACATYAWAKGQPAPNPLVDRRIVAAIEAELAARGMQKASENPGCYVIYQASLDEEKELQIWGSGGRWLGGSGTVRANTVTRGTLVVDIGHAASGQLIFRGIAQDTVSDKAEKNEKKLAKAVSKMFKSFPVGSARS